MAPSDAAAGLRVIDVSRRFQGLLALDSVSIDVPPGELVGLVGPNGAGKSTLIQIVSGFLRPSSGTVTAHGRSITGLRPEHIAALGVIRTFQTSRVFPALTVMESVLIGAHLHILRDGPTRLTPPYAEFLLALVRRGRYEARIREAEASCEAILRSFGDLLWPHRDDPAASLSYANRRRLEIARALVAEPSILLLDEPTAGMNPTESEELADRIQSIHETNPSLGILLVEHKMHIVRRLCTRVEVLNQGKTIASGTADAVLSDTAVIDAYLGTGRRS